MLLISSKYVKKNFGKTETQLCAMRLPLIAITKAHLFFLTYLLSYLKQEVYEKQNRTPEKNTDSADHNFVLDAVRVYFFYQPIFFYL